MAGGGTGADLALGLRGAGEGGPHQADNTMASPMDVSSFAEQLVREYLQKRNMESTLAAFDRESKFSKNTSSALESWYAVSNELDLVELLQRQALKGGVARPLVEVLVTELLSEESKKMRSRVEVSVTSGQNSLHFSTKLDVSDTWPAMPRPQTFEALKESQSQPVFELQVDDKFTAPPKLPAEAEDKDQRKRKLAAKGLPPGRKSDPSGKGGLQRGAGAPQPAGLLRRQKRNSESSKTLSNQAWIPEGARTRMFERTMVMTKLIIEKEEKRTGYLDALARKQSLSELEQNKAEERYQLKRTKRCGLCFREFSAVNLILSVPQKAIIDLQNTWLEKNPWIEMSEKERDKYQNPLLKRPTVLYNEVWCCVYCAQFFTKNQQDFYRPSYESKVAEKRDKAAHAAAEQARAFWDPLATVEQEKKTELEELERTVRLMETTGIASIQAHSAEAGEQGD